MLKNKIVIITGASTGIGSIIAEKMAGDGAIVNIFDLLSVKNEKLKNGKTQNKEVNNKVSKGKIFFYKVNVSDEDSVKNAVKDIVNKFESIDILVNSAGVFETKPFVEITEGEWDKIFNVDCKGTFICCKAVIPYMMNNKRGSIINISSIAGHIVRPNQAHYCSAKAAVIHLTKCLALEYAGYNIRVNCICPGMTNTPMLKSIIKARNWNEDEIKGGIPLKKFAEPEDHAEIAIFLASDKSSHLTGQIISIDGGQSLNYKW